MLTWLVLRLPAGITVASDGLGTDLMRSMYSQHITAIVYRALAYAEANAPTAARSGFIGPGAALDALQVVGKLLAEVRQDVLIVDPYMDSKIFTDFAPMSPAGATLRLLADSFSTKPEAVRPGMERWRQQFGSARPVEVRLSPPSKRCASAGARTAKSFSDPELAKMKVDCYEQIWTSSTPVT